MTERQINDAYPDSLNLRGREGIVKTALDAQTESVHKTEN